MSLGVDEFLLVGEYGLVDDYDMYEIRRREFACAMSDDSKAFVVADWLGRTGTDHMALDPGYVYMVEVGDSTFDAVANGSSDVFDEIMYENNDAVLLDEVGIYADSEVHVDTDMYDAIMYAIRNDAPEKVASASHEDEDVRAALRDLSEDIVFSSKEDDVDFAF